MSNATQAPRPAAVNLDAALAIAENRADLPQVSGILRALAADLAHTRAERDAALATLASIGLAEAAADADPVVVPDLPAFLAHRVNGAVQ